MLNVGILKLRFGRRNKLEGGDWKIEDGDKKLEVRD